MSEGELEMIRRISPVAVCCSRASVRERCTSAYDGAGWAPPWGRWRGVPHSPQNFIVGRFSCWHLGHVMPDLPAAGAAEGRNRGPRLTARDLYGQEHDHTSHAWKRRVTATSRRSCDARDVVKRGRHSACVTP